MFVGPDDVVVVVVVVVLVVVEINRIFWEHQETVLPLLLGKYRGSRVGVMVMTLCSMVIINVII